MQKNIDHALFVTFAVIFFSLSIPMFFFIEGALTMGGFGFMYHYLFGCGIILLGFVYFLLKPEAEYLVSLLKITAIFSLVSFSQMGLTCQNIIIRRTSFMHMSSI